ncbi:hypothetical protein ROG8370_02220 [Roseovarius gaetbuli]|uniref:Uncharacterized protein n=1 Tax=Roseovarius gaetbuli TaxID=1356575 RepID=A0A1X6ZFY7_9RHOB|nr:hypothetical protein [Roseovarius gaetbuli]SLN50355.1 hypothetical protein ROG8370_02220 [Roseovarius gaetbuli]
MDYIDVGAVLALAQSSFTNLDDFGDAFSSIQDLAGLPKKAENLGKLPSDVLAALLTDYLRRRADTALRGLQFRGVHDTVSVLDDTTHAGAARSITTAFTTGIGLGSCFAIPRAGAARSMVGALILTAARRLSGLARCLKPSQA